MSKKIYLSGKNKEKYVLVDDHDFINLKHYKWHLGTRGIIGKVLGKRIIMSRYILKINDNNILVDHKNSNFFDNQRNNLRIATKSENAMNSKINLRNKSGFKGVSYSKVKKKWRSDITLNQKDYFLGYFNNIINAINTRKKKELELFGDFSVLYRN